MSVIAPLFCFAFFAVIYAMNSSEPGVLTRWRVSFLAAAVTWGLILTAMTEVLSLFRLITFEWLLRLWMGAALLSAAICVTVSSRAKLMPLLQFPTIPRLESWCLAGVAAIALMVGLVAFVAPPNNADSMTYHTARVMHWIQNQTVAHYPTNILRQLFNPPWAEFAIMHLQVLSGGDRWSNLVQWFSMVGSIIGVSLIARQLRADAHGQVLTVVVVATIPMGILQASSTKNDYVMAFWLVCLMYYLLRFKMQPAWTHALGVGASLALALLAKATAYIYAVPLLVWFTFSALRSLRWKVWQPLLLIGITVLIINLGHYARNFDLWRNPLGIDQETSLANKVFGVPFIISNVIRNISLHIGTRSLRVNEAIHERIIRFLHTLLGINVNDPRTTWDGHFYQRWFSNHEDSAGNPLHFMLIMASLGLFLAFYDPNESQALIAYAIVLMSAFLMFCLYLQWSPWHSRPQLPLFVLWSPFISSVFLRRPNYFFTFLVILILIVASLLYVSQYAIVFMASFFVCYFYFKRQPWLRANYNIGFLIAILLISASTLYVFRNETRPLLVTNGNNSIFNRNRIDQLFTYHQNFRDAHFNATHFIDALDCSEIGLIIGDEDLEYPFWILLQEVRRTRIRIEHVNVTNISAIKATVSPFAGFSPCAIIAVEADHNTAPIAEGSVYTKAWSSGPRSMSTRRQELQVSVFTRRTDHQESR
jgi:hypothetical protein